MAPPLPPSRDDAAAEQALREGLARVPGDVVRLNDLGNLLRATHRAEEAVEAYRRAVFLRPGDGGLRGNLAMALIEAHRPGEAAVWIAQAQAAHPGDARLALIAASAEMALARPGPALAAYVRAQALARHAGQPSTEAQARFGEGLARLALGDWERGWPAYEARLDTPAFAAARRPFPPGARRWRGEALAGRRLVLTAEQGLGDVLQFARYAPLARARGAWVALQAPSALARLLAPLADQVLAPDAPPPPADFVCPLPSLPGVFATRPESVPPAPYLAAPPEREAAWHARLGPPRGLRLGLAWAGNPAHGWDTLRSLPEAALAPLLALPGVEAHALQPDARPADPRIAAHPDLADFADTAGLMTQMHAVIAVDTAVAHLAGALGRPGFLLLGHAPDFRWMLGRTDTPWYPSLHLARQPAPGDWATPLAEVAAALRASAQALLASA